MAGRRWSDAWQSAYTDIVFEDRLWPDYDGRDLWPAVQTYVDSERRYGGAAEAQKTSAKRTLRRREALTCGNAFPSDPRGPILGPNRTTTGEGSVRVRASVGAAQWDEYSAR